jgi:hypothetical protein
MFNFSFLTIPLSYMAKFIWSPISMVLSPKTLEHRSDPDPISFCIICETTENMTKCKHCGQNICCIECIKQLQKHSCPNCRGEPLIVIFKGKETEIMVQEPKERFFQLLKSDSFPILDVGNRQGDTGYIDYLKWEEVTNPIMKGVDRCYRKFIVIKHKVYDDGGSPIYLMFTIFQRYSDSESVYHICGHATDLIADTSGGADNEQFKLVVDLIEGKEVTILNEHRSPGFIGKKSSLMSNEDVQSQLVYRYHNYVQKG